MAYMEDGVDQRSVKRGKFGPLDIYPQEEKQKEDELNPEFVKSGFKYVIPELLKEYEFHTISNDSRDDNKPGHLINIQKERNKKDSNLDNDIVRILLSIVNKREEAAINTQIELNKKQQGPPKAAQTFKPSLILITGNPKTKDATYAWFKQLANNEPLAKLAKKIPVFNKRADNLPEIVITLYEYQVSITRAVWYLKIMVLAYSTNLNEGNKKKRQPNVDTSSEWSIPLVKFIRDIFYRLQFIDQHFQQNTVANPAQINITSLLNSNNLTMESLMNVENLSLILLPIITQNYLTENKLKNLWDFTTKLMRAMLDQNLLDKQYILESLIDLLEKSSINTKTSLPINALAENSAVKLLLSTIAQNMHHFLQSELLSRRLAYFCCKRISAMFNEYSQKFFEPTLKQLQQLTLNKSTNSPTTAAAGASTASNTSTSTTSSAPSPVDSSVEASNYTLKKNVSIEAIKILFDKFAECPTHRNQILLLTTIIQAIELGCMQALIWNSVGDGKTESAYNGSPLDLLPLPPSKLLYTYEYQGVTKQTFSSVKDELEKAELCIKRRSIAVENKWTTDKLKQPVVGIVHTKILAILDILDKHCYDLSDVNETIDTLYSQIFPKIKLYLLNKQFEPNKPSDLSDLINNSTNSSSTQSDALPTSNNNDANTSNPSSSSATYNNVNKPLSEKEIIFLLCDWATTTKRCGLHRLFYVVFLIRKRQLDWITQFKEVSSKMSKTINKNETLSKSTDTSPKTDELTKKRKFKTISSSSSSSSSSDEESKLEIITSAKRKLTQYGDESFAKKMKLDDTISHKLSASNTVTSQPTEIISTKKSAKKVNSQSLKRKKLTNKDTKSLFNFKLIKKLTNKLKQKQEILKEKERRIEKTKERKLRRILKEKELNKKLESQMYEYMYQNILFEYLETKASALDENSYESRLKFTNLVSLFYMFINCKLFSHDQFVCNLISRGETFKNNLNYIQRPIQAILMRNNISVYNTQTSQNTQQTGTKPQDNKQKLQSSLMNIRKSIDYTSPMSVYQQPASMPPYQLPPHTPLQAQKSFNNDSIYNAPHSVPTPSKSSSSNLNNLYQDEIQNNQNNMSFDNIPRSVQPQSQASGNVARLKASKILAKIKHQYLVQQQLKPMSKLASFVLHLPVPATNQFQHERNQRSVVLYGFGVKKQEILKNISSMSKNFFKLFDRKSLIDLSDVSLNTGDSNKRGNGSKYFNTITTSNSSLSTSEQELLNQLSAQYFKMTYFDQYSIMNKLTVHLVDIFKNLDQKNYLPKIQYLQFVFDLMESNLNVFNLILFAIRLLHVGPLIEQFLKKKFLKNLQQQPKICYFEYLSYFYLNLIGVLRIHLLSLVLWKDLACEVFKCLLKLVKNIEKPSKCSSHEKCALMLLNEMYMGCAYVKSKFSSQFESIAGKIRSEKCFTAAPPLDKINMTNLQMRQDEHLTSMITTTDYTIDEIEQYITSKNLYYNFVAHVFVSLSTLNKDEMLRVANLCAELSNRNSILITFWQNASKALYHRNTEITRDKNMFNELLNKINIQNFRSRENFKLFLSVLAARHCLILNEFIIMVVKTCVMACPGIMADQSHNFSILEPSAWLACHILQYLFTSAPKALVYRHTTSDRRMLIASFRSICFNSFLLVLKGLFLLSNPNKESSSNSNQKTNSKNSKPNSERSQSNNLANTNMNSLNSADDPELMELDQYASNVLQEICEHDWIKERCFNEGDNLLKTNQLLEPALGRRAQSLLHIICYPRNHHLRKQNEQSSTKDFIKTILQNLDIWTLRESLLEFKLMIELQKQKDNHYEYFVECLAKTTVDFLIDPEKPQPLIVRSISNNSNPQELALPEAAFNSEDNENLKSPLNDGDELMNDQNSSTVGEQKLAITDFLKNYETDTIYNYEFDSTDLQDTDELEILRIQKQNQPVGIWLIAPLISKLQDNCQLKVLEHASKTLHDLSKAFWNSKNKTEKETNAIKNITAWSQKPFFSLLISCLKNKDEQRPMLNSLFNGLSDFVSGKEDKILSEDPRLKQIMLETLHVRLSLVGSMFDFILRNPSDFLNWAWLFVQLIYSGVVEPDVDQLLFTMVIDMLVILIHHIITLEPNLDNNKHYQAIVKKISKETKDFSDVPNTRAINHIRRIMPLNRNACLDIMTVDPFATTATKTFPNSLDKRKGFKFLRKEKISTWELIEGVKNASSLCMSWYGSSKIERKMLRYEYQQKLLLRHKHLNLHKELTYFKENIDLPNDLVEIGQQIVIPPPTPPAVVAATTSAALNPQLSTQLSMNKKDTKQLVMPLGMNIVSNDSNLSPSNNSPSLHPGMMPISHPSAEIVILGSTPSGQVNMNTNIHPANMMMNNPNNMPTGFPQQMSNNQLIKERLQNPMTQNYQQPHIQQQQQQHLIQQQQQQHLLQQQPQLLNNMQMQQQQQLQQQPQILNEKSKPITNRSLSTPDKQPRAAGGGSAKKRTTTPRRGANAARAGANAAGVGAATGLPSGNSIQISQPNLMSNSQAMSQPKLIQQTQQQQQQTQIPQRSTNSPMIQQQQQPPYQMNPNPNNFQNRINPNQPMQINNPQLNVQGQGMNQRLPNQPSNYIANQNGLGNNNSNPGMTQFQGNMPPQSLTPQPPTTQQQQQQFMQQNQQRLPPVSNNVIMTQQVPPNRYSSNPVNQPSGVQQGTTTNLNIPHPSGSTTPTLQQQLAQQQPATQMARKLQPQQPPPPTPQQQQQQQQQQGQNMIAQQKPAPLYNTVNQAQQLGNRIIQPQQTQQQQANSQVYSMNNQGITKPVNTSTTPDPMMMMQSNQQQQPQQIKYQPSQSVNDPTMLAKQQLPQSQVYNNNANTGNNPNYMMQQQRIAQQQMAPQQQQPPRMQFNTAPQNLNTIHQSQNDQILNQQNNNWQQRQQPQQQQQQQQQTLQQRQQFQQQPQPPPQQFTQKQQQSSQIPMNANTNGNNIIQPHVMQQQQQQQPPRHMPNVTPQYQNYN